MVRSEEFRTYALIVSILSSVLLFTGLFGDWCKFNDFTTPNDVQGFNGKSIFGLWNFCADGTRTGLPFTPAAGKGNASDAGTAQIDACAHYGATYYSTIPVCGTCWSGPCCYNQRVTLFKLPDPDTNLYCARAFAVMAAVFAAFVGCGNHYAQNGEDRYEEKHGMGLGGGALASTTCGIIATATFVAFTKVDGFFFYTQELQTYENFDFGWGFIVFTAGWALMVLALIIQFLGLKKEEKEAAAEEQMNLKADV